jgi:nucleoid-associated protein EbfC
MFEGMKDMAKLVKQAKDMKSKMKDVQAELKKLTVEGYNKNRKVKVTLTGELECVDVEIDPAVLSPNNQKAIQKALQEAFNDAAEKSKGLATSRLSDISGDFNLPGLT